MRIILILEEPLYRAKTIILDLLKGLAALNSFRTKYIFIRVFKILKQNYH